MKLLTRKGPIILREGGVVQTDEGYIEILPYKHKYLFEIALLLLYLCNASRHMSSALH